MKKKMFRSLYPRQPAHGPLFLAFRYAPTIKMPDKKGLIRWVLALWLLIASVQAWAIGSYFNLTAEDDFFAGRDYGYTGGLQLDWSKGVASSYDELAPAWIAAAAKPLWLNSDWNKLRGVSYKVGMSVYTPQDLSRKDPAPDDLPYSGMIYWKAILHALDNYTADRAYLLLGMVGPLSGAEYVQNGIHDIIGSQRAQGWSSQLDNEPIFKIGAARRWRAAYRNFDNGRWGVDIVTNSEVGVGTFESTADQSLSFRIGQDLLHSYPTAGLLPGRDINPLAGVQGHNVNLFVTVMARYQLNAVYVQGNTFGGRHTDLKLEREQQAWSAGLEWNAGSWGYEFTMIRNTRIFYGPNAEQTYGQVSVTRKY